MFCTPHPTLEQKKLYPCYGTEFRCEFNAELLELITTTLNHTNRFVRETGYYVCTTLISACSEVASGDDSMEVDEVGVEVI